uniref:Uncharacterized protein n=1 Tax=Leersia perrieri TaxID=77586 RepID=A0A0D9WP17_9ORYZ
MGNSIGGRRKGAKVMQLDGTAFRVKPPANVAGVVLRDHPGFQLLESEEVKLLGVEKLMGESRDSAEAAAKIMQLCAAGGNNGGASGAVTPERGILRTPERFPRFIPTPDWGGAGGCLTQTTPEMSPRFAATPEWGTGFMMPTPERGSGLLRTPEYSSRDVKASRKEKRTRFVAMPDEIIA